MLCKILLLCLLFSHYITPEVGDGQGGLACCSPRGCRVTHDWATELNWTAWLSHVRLFATPWTVARQAPLSMGILQEGILEWVAMPSSRDLPNPGIKPRSPTLQVDSLPSEPPVVLFWNWKFYLFFGLICLLFMLSHSIPCFLGIMSVLM